MFLENRSRMHRVDSQLQAFPDGPCLPSLGYYTNHTSRLKNLSNRHRDGLARYFTKTAEPSLAYLLITTLLVEFDDKVWLLGLKVCGRIVECQMPVLPDANESCINYLVRN